MPLTPLSALPAAGTSLRREITAGLVTFGTLSYILFVQPAVLGLAGMDPGGVLFATCVASGLACLAMALLANYPFALAPAMGHNVFFALTLCASAELGGLGFRWQEALAANFVAGALFLAVARFGLRERVMHAIPEPLRYAIGAGIGLMIALVGFEWAGIVVDHPVVLVQLGDLGAPTTLVALFGLALMAVLHVRGTPGGLLIGLLATAAFGRALGTWLDGPELVRWNGVFGAPPDPSATAFQLDFAGLFARPWSDWLVVIAIFLVLDLFDTIGTLIGVADRANLLEDGKLPRARGALAADAAGTVAGTLLGTSTVTTYVESAAGVASGGRTGWTAIVVAVCLFASLFFTPLLEAIGAGVNIGTDTAPIMRYPVIAPVLVLVGVLMLGAVRRIPWDDPATAISAFLTIAVMQLSVSITDGIAWGFLSWSLLSFARGRPRDAGWMVHAFALLFLVRYVWLR